MALDSDEIDQGSLYPDDGNRMEESEGSEEEEYQEVAPPMSKHQQSQVNSHVMEQVSFFPYLGPLLLRGSLSLIIRY